MVDFVLHLYFENLGIQISRFGPNSHYFSPVPLTPSLASSSLYTTEKRNQKMFWNYSRQLKGSWIISGLAFEAMAGVKQVGIQIAKNSNNIEN